MSSVKTTNTQIELPYFYVGIDLRTIVDYSDPAYEARKQSFIDRAYGLQAEAREETERLTVNVIEFLDNAHEKLVAKCKDANGDLETMVNQKFRYEQKSRDLDKALTLAHLNLKIARESKPNPSFMLKSDIAAYETDVAAKQAEVEGILGKMRNAEVELKIYLNSCEAKRQELLNLMAEEQNLRLRLERLRGNNLSLQPTTLGLSV